MRTATISIVGAVLVLVGLRATASMQATEAGVPGPRLVVPVVKAAPVVTDGRFSPGEWDGALRQSLSGDFDVYLLADARYLYVGFKFLKAVQTSLLAEVYVATGERTFVNLHSSGALGEGENTIPLAGGRTRFEVVTPPGGSRAAWWESNATPRDPAVVDGKEFKISRSRLPGGTLRLAGSIAAVSRTLREEASFPADRGFASFDAWAELALSQLSPRPAR